MDSGTPGLLVSTAYDKQQVCLYQQPFSR